MLCAVKHPFVVTKDSNHLLCCELQFSAPTQIGDSTGDEAELDLTRTKNKNIINSDAMNSDSKNMSDIDPDNIIPAAMEDLSEEDQLEIERLLEEQKAESKRLMLAGFKKTRNGAFRKVAAPSAMPSTLSLLGTEVNNPTESLAHLIDTSVASKFGSSIDNQMHILTKSMADQFDVLRAKLSKDLGVSLSHHDQSLGQHAEHENHDKKIDVF